MKRMINLSPVNYWSEQPFINRMRAAYSTVSAPVNAIRGQFLIPADSIGSRFVLIWDGGGTVAIGQGLRQISQAPGRVVCVAEGDNGAGSWMLTLRSDGQSNHRLVREDEEAALAAGAMFRTDFLDDMARFDAFRTMDWTGTNGSTRTTMDMAMVRTIVDLANLTGMRPWICVPHLVTDAGIAELVAFLDASCKPRPIVEFSNEVWNWQFGQAKYAGGQIDAAGVSLLQPASRDPSEWCGRQIARLLKAVQGTRVGVVAASQTVDPSKGRRLIAGLVAAGGDPKALEAIAIATYVDGQLNDFAVNPRQALDLMARNDVAGAHAAMMAYLPKQRALYQPWADMAKQYGVRLWGYEGGQYHLNSRSVGAQAEPLRQFFKAVQLAPASADTLEAYYALFESVGGDMDAIYNLTSGSTLDGFFGVKQQPIWPRLKPIETPATPPPAVPLPDELTVNGRLYRAVPTRGAPA